MRGAELPINTIVIIVVCLLVLLSVIILFFMGWSPWSANASRDLATRNACTLLNSMGCRMDPGNISVKDFDADKDGKFDPWKGEDVVSGANCASPGDTRTYDSLWSLCVCYYNLPTSAEGINSCKVSICGCPNDTV